MLDELLTKELYKESLDCMNLCEHIWIWKHIFIAFVRIIFLKHMENTYKEHRLLYVYTGQNEKALLNSQFEYRNIFLLLS